MQFHEKKILIYLFSQVFFLPRLFLNFLARCEGLGANHLYKILVSDNDHLEFYQVGTKSASLPDGGIALTGCLEFGINKGSLEAAGIDPEKILDTISSSECQGKYILI